MLGSQCVLRCYWLQSIILTTYQFQLHNFSLSPSLHLLSLLDRTQYWGLVTKGKLTVAVSSCSKHQHREWAHR